MTRVVVAELNDVGPPTFWGLLLMPDNLTVEDIPRLYRQWYNLDDDKPDFPDWLKVGHGVGEEPAAFCWLDPYLHLGR